MCVPVCILTKSNNIALGVIILHAYQFLSTGDRMASSAETLLMVLVIVLALRACSCECVYYVKPSQRTMCPAGPCFTLEDYY